LYHGLEPYSRVRVRVGVGVGIGIGLLTACVIFFQVKKMNHDSDCSNLSFDKEPYGFVSHSDIASEEDGYVEEGKLNNTIFLG
jgi:hypothetical protein